MKRLYFLHSFIMGLFFSLCLITAAQAAESPSGKIVRIIGSVEVVRHGETMKGTADLKIYPLDKIITGPDSLVELIFKDGSSLHIGPDSHFRLDQYVFSINEDKPSFIGEMAKGLYVYVSGAISKIKPDAVKFKAPQATIGIRGTKLVVKIESISTSETKPQTPPNTIVILFRDNTGQVGTVTISNQRGIETLDKEFHAVTINYGNAPSKQVVMDKKTLEKMFPKFLHEIIFENFTPPLPYTERFMTLDELRNLFQESAEKPRPVSASSP